MCVCGGGGGRGRGKGRGEGEEEGEGETCKLNKGIVHAGLWMRGSAV